MWTIYLQRLSKIRTFSFGKGEKGRWGSSRLFLLFTIDLCENWPAKLPFPANDPELETSPVLVPFPKFKTLPIAQPTREFSDFAKLIAQTTSCDENHFIINNNNNMFCAGIFHSQSHIVQVSTTEISYLG